MAERPESRSVAAALGAEIARLQAELARLTVERDAARAALARLVDHYQPSHYHGGKRPDETCLWCAARAALEATP